MWGLTGVKHTNMIQQSIFDDISPHKLHRKDDPETSKEAARTAPL